MPTAITTTRRDSTMDLPFSERLDALRNQQSRLLGTQNRPRERVSNGLIERFANPVLTREHTPLEWRYDLDERTNPLLLERMGINAVFNPGAMMFEGKVTLCCRVEGADRKSFFAIAQSETGIDRFRFWDEPCVIPEFDEPATNVYDMRLTAHEDGWIYGVFCVERKAQGEHASDLSAAEAQCGVVRTKDLRTFERLFDIRTPSPQQRNVALHPEFVDGKKYLLYTRPQDGFISAGGQSGIAWGLSDSMERCVLEREHTLDARAYHTIKEAKNGIGPAPIRTEQGWLHLAHGVRPCAAGLRYVLYAFLASPDDPRVVTHRPGGHLMGPLGDERVGDVSNVLFSNGWVALDDGTVLIYYASSDTRTHVARTSVDRLVDYCLNTPEDPLFTGACVQQRLGLIRKNAALGQPSD